MNNSLYATLDQAKSYMSFASQNVGDDDKIFGFIRRASRSIDKYCRRKFYPQRETRYYNYRFGDVLKLDSELLQLDTLTTQNGGETIDLSAVILQTGENYNYGPWDTIVLRSDSGSQFNYSGTDQKANAVVGFWGYRENYGEEAWVNTGTSLAGSYAASGTSLSLAGAGSAGVGASDVNYDAPRISPGDLLMVGGEMFNVVAGSGPNQSIVIPHSNGTSANNHASGTAIYKYAPEPDINWTTIRLTSWLYGQGMSPYESKTAFIQLGTITMPTNAISSDIKDRLDRFRKTTLVIYPDN